MNKLVLALVLVASCGKKDDGGDKAVPAPAPAPAPAPGPAPTPAPAPAPDPAPAAPAVDCEKLATPDEVAAACGVAAADVTIVKAPMESGTGATTCMRSIKLKKKGVTTIAVNTATGGAAGAKSLVDLSRKTEGATIKDVAVGDAGILIVHEMAALKTTSHDIEAAKGAIWFKQTTNVDGSEKPWCSDDGLVKLATTVASHLP